MANAETEPKIHDFMSEVGKGNIFGQCELEDFVSAETEKKKKDRVIKLEKKKRLEEMRRADEEKKRQEEEDFEFALQEQQRLNKEEFKQRLSNFSPQKMYGRGRGHIQRPNLERGKSDQQEIPVFKRERVVKNQIHQFAGGEYHSNKALKQYWHGDKVAPSNTVDFHPEQFDDAFSGSPRSESSSYQSVPSSSSTSPVLVPVEVTTLRRDSPSYFPALCNDDPYYTPTLRSEAPRFTSTLRSEAPCFTSTLRSETPSNIEAPSKTPDPCNEAPLISKTPRNTPTKRKSRLAANFSNKALDEDEKDAPVQQKDWFEVRTLSEQPLTARPRPRDYVSINDLRASQRVLQPRQALFQPPPDYIYNEKEFPSL